jgi:uncharacterized protein
MSVSMYDAAVPTMIRGLENLADVLEKAGQHATAKNIAPEALVGARLFPDMFALARQVQIAADSAKGGCARLAQVEVPSFEDNETTFAQLVERARKTIAFLQTLKPAQFEGAEQRTVTWKVRAGERSMQGQPYLFTHVLPNFFFHCVTTYNILRHNGVELGKQDFLGKPKS